jgi:hypothetical protein
MSFAKLASLFMTWFPLLVVALLAAIFLWRRLFRGLPFFFLYLVAALLITALRLSMVRMVDVGGRAYFYTYWISELVGAPIVALAIYEVFLRRLFPGFQRNRFYRNIFPLCAVLILVLTVFTVLQVPDKRAAFKMASRGFDFMRTAVLVFFIGLMALMGRHWPRYDLGIALGFGLQAAVALANAAVSTQMHYKPTFMKTLEAVSYSITVVIWLIAFWKPETPSQIVPAEQLDPAMLHQARGWEQQLKTWLTPRKDKG